MKHTIIRFFFLLVIFCYSCSDKKRGPQLFELLPSGKTHITFANTITTNDSLNALNFDYIYNGGGVATGDINNDGLPDIYFTGNQVSGKLYLNKGNMQFEDITRQAGVGTNKWTTGVAMVDINADGFMDIYVCAANRDTLASTNLLFINNGDNTFSEKAAAYGLADNGYSTQAAFLDYDLDGDLDMYLLTNALESFSRNTTRPKQLQGEAKSTDRLYRNDTPRNLASGNTSSNMVFTDVSREAGILAEGYGLGVAVSDINQDGWPDIYVANDFITNDILWINNGDGTFTDQAARAVKHQSHNGMGTDVADFNNDGLVDIVVLDMLPEDNLRQKTMFPAINFDRFDMAVQYGYIPQYVRNTLQLNNGNGTFSEIGQLAGIHNTDWSWSALFADYDNDGYKDLLITNGYRKDVTDLDFVSYSRENAMFGSEAANKKRVLNELNNLKGAHVHNYIFQNEGNLTFTDQSQAWGLDTPTYSNGAAYADLDNDGDLDLVINNIDQEASVYRNNAEKFGKNNYLIVHLEGGGSNKNAFGAKVKLTNQGKIQYQEQSPYRGYKSTVEPVLHFGLGKQALIDTLEVTWPDGRYQLLTQVKANQLLRIAYTSATERIITGTPVKTLGQPLFTEVSRQLGVQYKHEESKFVDFKVQPLLPHKYSQNGPGIAVGDADGNGLDDFYIGGAANHPGMLFYQQAAGKFEGKALVQKRQEDMGSLFFDADNDNDLDLYVVSGGGEFPAGSALYQDRFYRNDGKGNFSLDSLALPPMLTSGSCVTAADFDQDGDLDLFVGGRVVPGKYPLPAQSYILQNNGGTFTDVTPQVCKELQQIGLVTAALWTDFDNDSQMDLIVTGEWMPIRFFKNVQGKLVAWDADTGVIQTDTHTSASNESQIYTISHSSGWWNSLVAGDFDNDGDTDYIGGNLGLNSKYKASSQEPVCVYAKDYDENGSLDPVLCYYIMGKNYPTHPRDVMNSQINGMRGRFPRYEIYGKATLDQVFTQEEIKGAYITRSEYFQSSYIENTGNGRFSIRPLPIQAQIAPVFGMLTGDFNQDGHLDVLLTGNSYATEVQTGWYDASIGLYLKGDGKGNFLPVSVNESGFMVDSDAKGIAQLTSREGNSYILVSSNADSLQVFTNQKQPGSNWQTLSLQPMDAYAEIKFKNGRQEKKEFYYGSTYLSQSSRYLSFPAGVESVTVYDYRGKSRQVAVAKPPISLK